jgi:hypothetical protein
VACINSISRKGNQQVNKHESKRDTILSHGLGDLLIAPNPRWGGFKHLILFSITDHFSNKKDSHKSNLTLREINTLNLSKPWFHYSCSSPLRWGKHNTSHKNTEPPSQSSWRAHGFHSSKPSRRRQPPKVTSWWCLLEESLVPQSSRTLKSSIRISHTYNGSRKACVRKERALKCQVCCWNGQGGFLARDGRVYIAHTTKTSHWKDFAHFTIRP